MAIRKKELRKQLSRPRLLDGNRREDNNKKSTRTEQEDKNWNYPETRRCRVGNSHGLKVDIVCCFAKGRAGSRKKNVPHIEDAER
jgi:hypothetical protein